MYVRVCACGVCMCLNFGTSPHFSHFDYASRPNWFRFTIPNHSSVVHAIFPRRRLSCIPFFPSISCFRVIAENQRFSFYSRNQTFWGHHHDSVEKEAKINQSDPIPNLQSSNPLFIRFDSIRCMNGIFPFSFDGTSIATLLLRVCRC